MTTDDNPFGGEPVRIPVTDVFDLHTVPPREVKAVVEEYLAEAHRLGLKALRIVTAAGSECKERWCGECWGGRSSSPSFATLRRGWWLGRHHCHAPLAAFLSGSGREYPDGRKRGDRRRVCRNERFCLFWPQDHVLRFCASQPMVVEILFPTDTGSVRAAQRGHGVFSKQGARLGTESSVPAFSQRFARTRIPTC